MKSFINKFKDLDVPIHGVRLPSFDIENKHKRANGLSEDVDNYDFLRGMCLKGFKKLNLKKNSKEYKAYVERTKKELKILQELEFIDYILLVWTVINFCKEKNIPVGLGRGSAAGSLVLFLIEVTGIDPIKYGLYFERFISKIRAKKQVVDGVTYLDGSLMCDIDLDICYYNRGEVIKFLEDKFEGRTSKIITLNTLSTKLLMKECGKIVAGKSEESMNKVSAMIPKVFGQVKELKESYEEVESLKDWCDKNPETYNIALKLRGLIKNKGVHPSAISLSYDPMIDSCPTELSSDKNSVSSFDMNWVSLFNVKLDILGLRSVSVVDDVCKSVGISITDIDLSDEIIYQNLYDLRTPHGLFQIEADTNFSVCRKVKPKNLEELSGVLALARPGALAFVDQYATYTNTGAIESIHPFFDDILSSTGGVALYQEQLMQMAHKVGFTLDEAEILRRIVGKKKVTEARKWKKKIRDKVKENNLDEKISTILWKILEDSANYSFNKSHSIAYAALAAVTTYLKFKYPQQFFLSLLKMTRHEPDPISEISKVHRELDLFGMKLLPPHITKSELDFSFEGEDLRFGLLSIKGISDKSIEKLNNFRDRYSNKFEVFQAANEANLNIGTLSALIQAGALEGFKQSRSKVVLEAQLWNVLTQREKKHCMTLAEKNDYDLIKIIKLLTIFKDDKGKVVIRESRMGTIKRKYGPYVKIYQQNSSSESFANWYYEKSLLGYTYNKTLKDIFDEKRPNLLYIRDILSTEGSPNVAFIGQIEDAWSGVSRTAKKTPYHKMLISDETGMTKTMIFSFKKDECEKINEGLPKKKNIVIVTGKKMDDDMIFANTIGIQENKIYTKLSEIKDL
jgi:DNA polymerase-3 subunit alpha